MDYFRSALYDRWGWRACWCRQDKGNSSDRALQHRLARRLIRRADKAATIAGEWE